MLLPMFFMSSLGFDVAFAPAAHLTFALNIHSFERTIFIIVSHSDQSNLICNVFLLLWDSKHLHEQNDFPALSNVKMNTDET